MEGNWWKWLLGIVLTFFGLIAVYIVAMYFYRRQMRRRKIAARRRALEMQRRRQNIRDVWPNE